MRAPAPASNSVSFLMSISSVKPLSANFSAKGPFQQNWRQVVDLDKSSRNRPRKNVPRRERRVGTCRRLQQGCQTSRVRQILRSIVSRDDHGRNGDRAIIFARACQTTGSTSSAAPSKTSVVTTVLLKNIES